MAFLEGVVQSARGLSRKAMLQIYVVSEDIPPGDPILINVEPFELDDSVPEDIDIRAVMTGM